jgi:hypothetical protein
MRRVRPSGTIRILDPRGVAYLPKIVRDELGVSGKDIIPFVLDANCVLMIRKDATLKAILEGLDILKRDLKLRSSRGV